MTLRTALLIFSALPFTRAVLPWLEAMRKNDCKCGVDNNAVCVQEGPYQYSYVNKCLFKCAARKRKDLKILYDGACCSAQHCGMFQPPVCSNDGQMYRTNCEFEERQCVEHRQFGKHISMNSDHEKCNCIMPCETEWQPVCDKKGQTHANFCTFLNNKCYHKQQLNETIEIDYTGTCCEDICSTGQSALTVCDSKGKTHTDLCSFYVEQCREKRRGTNLGRLRIAGVGPCRPKNPLLRSFDFFMSRFPSYYSPASINIIQ